MELSVACNQGNQAMLLPWKPHIYESGISHMGRSKFPCHLLKAKPDHNSFVQILFPLRGERISNLIDFLRELFPIAGWEFFFSFGNMGKVV